MSGQYNLNAPCSNGVSYTDADSSNHTFTATSRKIYIGAAGNLALTMEQGTVIFVACVAGTVLEVEATASVAASTTVSDITVLW